MWTQGRNESVGARDVRLGPRRTAVGQCVPEAPRQSRSAPPRSHSTVGCGGGAVSKVSTCFQFRVFLADDVAGLAFFMGEWMFAEQKQDWVQSVAAAATA